MSQPTDLHQLRGLLSGAQYDVELEPWKEAFVDMFLQTGASIGQGFGMKPETIASMRTQISQMMSSVPIEDARQMLQLSIMQAHKVLNLMPAPEVVSNVPGTEVNIPSSYPEGEQTGDE